MPAIEFYSNSLVPRRRAQDPFARLKRRAMANVLIVATGKFSSPITEFILVKCNDLLIHLRRAGTGFHQRNIVRAIAQQISDATTRGTSCLNS